MSEIHKSKDPVLITEHGRPSAYLVDVDSFESSQRRLVLLEGIARGEKAYEEGRVFSSKQAKQKLKRWLK